MEKIYKATKYLRRKYKLNGGFFCIYGSFATKTNHRGSDIDIMYINNFNNRIPLRMSDTYEKTSISLYIVSIEELMRDAAGKYGGFFCGKIFNPHVLIDSGKDSDQLLEKIVSAYFSNLISTNNFSYNKIYSPNKILKNLINSYIELFPEYFAYVLRLYKSAKFTKIWNAWRNTLIESLINAKIIEKSAEGKGYIIKTINSYEHFNSFKIDCISRFWIFGAISHNSNINFYDYYKNKNLTYIDKNSDLVGKLKRFLQI